MRARGRNRVSEKERVCQRERERERVCQREREREREEAFPHHVHLKGGSHVTIVEKIAALFM